MARMRWGLIGLSVLAFVLAVVSALSHKMIAGVHAEGFSRASSNLALIAIALTVLPPGRPQGS